MTAPKVGDRVRVAAFEGEVMWVGPIMGTDNIMVSASGFLCPSTAIEVIPPPEPVTR